MVVVSFDIIQIMDGSVFSLEISTNRRVAWLSDKQQIWDINTKTHIITAVAVAVFTFLRAVFLSAALPKAKPGPERGVRCNHSLHHKNRNWCERLRLLLGVKPAAPFPFPTATRQLVDLLRPSLAVMLNTLFTCKSNKKQTPLLSHYKTL